MSVLYGMNHVKTNITENTLFTISNSVLFPRHKNESYHVPLERDVLLLDLRHESWHVWTKWIRNVNLNAYSIKSSIFFIYIFCKRNISRSILLVRIIGYKYNSRKYSNLLGSLLVVSINQCFPLFPNFPRNPIFRCAKNYHVTWLSVWWGLISRSWQMSVYKYHLAPCIICLCNCNTFHRYNLEDNLILGQH